MVGRRIALVPLAVIALVAAACSSSGGATASPSVAASVAPPSAAASPAASAEASVEPSASASEAAGESYPLAVATVPAGSTLTGEDGKTLYFFKADTKDAGKSTCNADCATNWPPYTLEADEKLEQDAAVTGTITMITRDDGTKQVAYNGWPLYYFKGDAKAGDSNGQNLDAFGGIWVIAAP
jgi:predicted lipoprotein with Yx(FWY)xxD motif